MNKDDKIIAILQDTIARCEARNAKPQRGRYHVRILIILTLILSPLTLYYSHSNEQLENRIVNLQKEIDKQAPRYQRVLMNDFLVDPKPLNCAYQLTQHLGDKSICVDLI